MRTIFDILNDPNANSEPVREVRIGAVYAANYAGEYHRAKVLYVAKSMDSEQGDAVVAPLRKRSYRCQFIDFGMEKEVELHELRQIGTGTHQQQYADYPPRAFECRLAEIQPSSLASEHSTWTVDATTTFSNLVNNLIVTAEIYSVVDNVANVYLRAAGDTNVNQFLITEGVAQQSEETYMSKVNHTFRKKHQRAQPIDGSAGDASWLDEEMLKSIGESAFEQVTEFRPSQANLNNQVPLKGPFSPLECKIYGAVAASASKSASIDPHSVNSILLSSCTHDATESLLVAVNMTETAGGNQVMARETTLMPNIPGFAAMIAMIFAPRIDLMQDEHRTRYVSLLCGLGASSQLNGSMFEEHDVEFNLDVHIDNDDLQDINQIRFALDSILFTMVGQDRPTITATQLKTNTHKIKKLIIR